MVVDNKCGDNVKSFLQIRDILSDGPEGQTMNGALQGEAEQQQLLIEPDATRHDYPIERCLHQLIEAQVERTPDAIAVIFEQEQLSYQELDRRANQLAHYLKQLGVGPEVRVGICIERCLEMFVGLLGILKAGGVYVPLDPNYPTERLAFMLTDARTPVLLTQQRVLPCLPTHQARVVCLDTDWQQIATQPLTTPSSTASPDNLAYVIYTSGSTGTPRGVMVIHRELVNRILAMIELYKLDSNHRVLQFISLSFDASVEEIFPALAAGATLISHHNPAELLVTELLHAYEKLKVTLLHMPAAYWHQMIDELESLQQSVPESVKTAIVGGESLSIDRLITWFRLAKQPTRFFNVYGLTETTITSTTYEASPELAVISKCKYLPIGKPLANTEIYVLDSYLQPVAIGVSGEIYIGGAGLARGYLGRPDLTAEKFIPNPFSAVPGARLYKTGDLARYLPDGNIEFLGRQDQQVKLRGYRIELGEIEFVLARHPAVRQAVVMARQEIAADKYLAAYVVLHRDRRTSMSELQTHASQHLPDYMVPTAIVFLERLPLTPTGKLDRRALPVPEQLRPALAADFLAARTPIEEIISATWSRVLEIEQIGIHDNFFALGGHSLQAMKMLSQLRATLQVEVPLHRFLEAPTIVQLAELFQQLQTNSTHSRKSPLRSISREAYQMTPVRENLRKIISNEQQ